MTLPAHSPARYKPNETAQPTNITSRPSTSHTPRPIHLSFPIPTRTALNPLRLQHSTSLPMSLTSDNGRTISKSHSTKWRTRHTTGLNSVSSPTPWRCPQVITPSITPQLRSHSPLPKDTSALPTAMTRAMSLYVQNSTTGDNTPHTTSRAVHSPSHTTPSETPSPSQVLPTHTTALLYKYTPRATTCSMCPKNKKPNPSSSHSLSIPSSLPTKATCPTQHAMSTITPLTSSAHRATIPMSSSMLS